MKYSDLVNFGRRLLQHWGGCQMANKRPYVRKYSENWITVRKYDGFYIL